MLVPQHHKWSSLRLPNWVGSMAEEWRMEEILECPPSRQKVLLKDSKAFIRAPKDLIAYRELYNALKPYQEKYEKWQYRFLCHLVFCSIHDMAIHGDLPGVPIPWNARRKSFHSMTQEDLEELIQDGLMTRDYYDQAKGKCYWYFMGDRLTEQVLDA